MDAGSVPRANLARVEGQPGAAFSEPGAVAVARDAGRAPHADQRRRPSPFQTPRPARTAPHGDALIAHLHAIVPLYL